MYSHLTLGNIEIYIHRNDYFASANEFATHLIVLPDLSYLDCIVIISTYLRYL